MPITKHKLTLERILELSDAVETVTNNDRLSGKTSYWLGRFGDYCSGPLRTFKANQSKALLKIKPEQDKLIKDFQALDAVKDKLDRERINREIQELNMQYAEVIKELKEQEEDIDIPDFKMSEFMAEQDIVYPETVKDVDKDGKEITKKVEFTIKKGRSLVPIKFFKLMGEYIRE